MSSSLVVVVVMVVIFTGIRILVGCRLNYTKDELKMRNRQREGDFIFSMFQDKSLSIFKL